MYLEITLDENNQIVSTPTIVIHKADDTLLDGRTVPVWKVDAMMNGRILRTMPCYSIRYAQQVARAWKDAPAEIVTGEAAPTTTRVRQPTPQAVQLSLL